MDGGRSRQKSTDLTDSLSSDQYQDPPIPQREPYTEPENRNQQQPRLLPQQQVHQQPKFDHRHARSYDGFEQPQQKNEINHRHTGSLDGYYPDGTGEPRFNQPEQPHSQPSESDYDSDGNLMTPEEKSRRARQLQRQREYEERLAKWEAERLQKEEEERRQEQLAEEEAERAYEVTYFLTVIVSNH